MCDIHVEAFFLPVDLHREAKSHVDGMNFHCDLSYARVVWINKIDKRGRR